MGNLKVLIGLTLAVFVLTVVMIFTIDASSLSAYGSILAACGSFTAVIWFTGSLKYQAKQLEEQRIQFQKQFLKSHEDGRRNALLLAKDILLKTEEKALAANKELNSIAEIFPNYVNFGELKDIYESKDHLVVQDALTSWNKKEGPACAIMQGIKSAAQVYFLAIGKDDIDYTKEPEEFVFVYGSHLWELPFFSDFTSCAKPLSEYMIKIQPGRQGAIFAIYGLMANTASPDFLKLDEIREDMKNFESKGRVLPQIALSLKNT
ncbi:hypothetical protein CDB79_RS09510 [Vibrio parahaemolyticus]|uniref:hypothetical protein n=2 Tax=Vibrio parahaemolyticus TaxID=670 RepID=UPI000DFE3522|nr:hypothetical protein [Vibrio parahaemolyticus]EJG1710832.1 hypothetical protein [Vibrio parahaemolyticus]EJG1742208.1 hypothetical protein [Vibrio parahaemolyticus]EJG1778953.1 hypothetical protein [Vibrio parahaemolyticus]SUP25920.1 Uncharacterised protein [Vibrio parahaemolyticus]